MAIVVESFEVGKYYRWVGPKEPDYFSDKMRFVLNKKPHKCIVSHLMKSLASTKLVAFEGNDISWYWDPDHFEEVAPNKQLELIF